MSRTGQGQTLLATSATNSNLRRWPSHEIKFPSLTEAKPHCGLIASGMPVKWLMRLGGIGNRVPSRGQGQQGEHDGRRRE